MSPEQIVDKWSNRVQASRSEMEAGANNLDVSPGELAANNIQRYADGVQRSLANGHTEARMRAVPLSYWQERYKRKGIPNAMNAATNATVKQNVLAYQREAASTYADIKARARAMRAQGASGKDIAMMAIDKMEEFGRQRRK